MRLFRKIRRNKDEKSRYKWLIRPLIHRNAIASLDWIGKSAPVPLLSKKLGRSFTSVQMFHTHTHLLRIAFRICEVECILHAKQQSHLDEQDKVAAKSSECLKVRLKIRLQKLYRKRNHSK